MKKISLLLYIWSMLFWGISCSKMDDPVKPFIEGGEIVYSTKVDTLQSFSGHNRVLLVWELPANHSAKKMMAFWNNNKDSVAFDFKKVEGKVYQAEIKDLPEATYLFDIYTVDAGGNKSVKTLTSVNVYGENYESTLLNRILSSAIIDGNNQLRVVFESADEGNVDTKIAYIATNGQEKSTSLKSTENELVISDWKIGTLITYQSSYRPEENAIDVFYVPKAGVINVIKDVSAEFLKNYQQPFLSVQESNRFRDPLHWSVNSAIQNHDGMGGWGSDDNTVLVMESGWGASNIVNGKMYQTAVLPKGDYSVKVELGGFGLESSLVKIVAVSGTTVSDFDNNMQVPNALGSANLQLKEFKFTVLTTGAVSIGFLANMTGDQYWRVSKVSLFRHF